MGSARHIGEGGTLTRPTARRPLVARPILAALAAASLALGLVGPIQLAQAASITVTTTADEFDVDNGACSLREAIRSANTDTGLGGCPAGSGADTIVLPPGTFTLSLGPAGDALAASGDLDVNGGDLSILGAGAGVTIIDGAQIDRVFQVDPGLDGITARMSDLTIRNGNAMGTGGGAIENNGTLELTRAALTGNTAEFAGGGLDNYGTATVVDTVVSGNSTTADRGGGLENRNASTLTVINSTVSGNRAEEDGGGIRTIGDAATLNSVTITNNTADADLGGDPGDGGGVSVGSGELLTISNSIVAGNHDATDPDCSGLGSVTSGGFNLIGVVGVGCTFTSTTGDKTGAPASPINPMLLGLADNGGPTQTHELAFASPARDAAGPGVPPADQRGAPRATPDMGAYELVTCFKRPVTEVGTEDNDTMVGTSAYEVYLALAGNDTVIGKGGPDHVCGGKGKDTLRGGSGNDRLAGEQGNDQLRGQRDRDRLKGGPGKDTCVGGGGIDKATCEEEKSVP